MIKPGTDPHKRFNPDNLTPSSRRGWRCTPALHARLLAVPGAEGAAHPLEDPGRHRERLEVGPNGATALVDAVVQCIGILELGVGIGKSLVTPKNIGVYEAEHHIDNSMGTGGQSDPGMDGLGDYITRGQGGNQPTWRRRRRPAASVPTTSPPARSR